MEHSWIFGIVFLALWFTSAALFYFVARRQWSLLDDLTPSERAKLFETRRQRHLKAMQSRERR